MNPIAIQNFDLSMLQFGAIKTTANGAKMIETTYNGRKAWGVKLPKMTIPFTVAKSTQGGYEISLTIDEHVPDVLNKLHEFDVRCIEEGSIPDNTVSWLGASSKKPYSREIVETKYKPTIKYSKDKATGEINDRFPPRIAVKLPVNAKTNQFTTEFYDNKCEPIDINPDNVSSMLTKNTQCSVLMTPMFWCNNTNGYGCSWRAKQVKLIGRKVVKQCLLDPEEEEVDEDNE